MTNCWLCKEDKIVWAKYAKTELHLRQLCDPSETSLVCQGAGCVKERTPQAFSRGDPGGLGCACTPSLHSQPFKMPHHHHTTVKATIRNFCWAVATAASMATGGNYRCLIQSSQGAGLKHCPSAAHATNTKSSSLYKPPHSQCTTRATERGAFFSWMKLIVYILSLLCALHHPDVRMLNCGHGNKRKMQFWHGYAILT